MLLKTQGGKQQLSKRS